MCTTITNIPQKYKINTSQNNNNAIENKDNTSVLTFAEAFIAMLMSDQEEIPNLIENKDFDYMVQTIFLHKQDMEAYIF